MNTQFLSRRRRECVQHSTHTHTDCIHTTFTEHFTQTGTDGIRLSTYRPPRGKWSERTRTIRTLTSMYVGSRVRRRCIQSIRVWTWTWTSERHRDAGGGASGYYRALVLTSGVKRVLHTRCATDASTHSRAQALGLALELTRRSAESFGQKRKQQGRRGTQACGFLACFLHRQ